MNFIGQAKALWPHNLEKRKRLRKAVISLSLSLSLSVCVLVGRFCALIFFSALIFIFFCCFFFLRFLCYYIHIIICRTAGSSGPPSRKEGVKKDGDKSSRINAMSENYEPPDAPKKRRKTAGNARRAPISNAYVPVYRFAISYLLLWILNYWW